MKLVASMIVRNEVDRYLPFCLDHLLDFVDEIRIMDDHSDDGTAEFLSALSDGDDRINFAPLEGDLMFLNEGRARNVLLDFTLDSPGVTHVLAIDADEFVADGSLIRDAIEDVSGAEAWKLGMVEVWGADAEGLSTREDGGWKARQASYVWKIPPARVARTNRWRIPAKQLASGRVPQAINLSRRVGPGGTDLLHFGWANVGDRAARYERYVEHDGGKFHASKHLQSIMWGDDQVTIERRPWPGGLDEVKAEILARANLVPEPKLRDVITYDHDADVLYFSLYDPPVEAMTVEDDAGRLWRYRTQIETGDLELVGMTHPGYREHVVARGLREIEGLAVELEREEPDAK